MMPSIYQFSGGVLGIASVGFSLRVEGGEGRCRMLSLVDSLSQFKSYFVPSSLQDYIYLVQQ